MNIKCLFICLAAALQAFGTTLYTDTLGPDGQLVEKAPAADSSTISLNGLADTDNDGLGDALERLASAIEIGKAYAMDPSNAHSVVSATNALGRTYSDIVVPDYFFSPFGGNVTWGSMLTDHDQMEDELESSNIVQKLAGHLARGVWDATADADGDGWSNFAEIRAFQADLAYAGSPVPDIEIKVVYNGARSDGTYTVKAFPSNALSGPPDATWTGVTNGTDGVIHLGRPTSGALKEGVHAFIVHAGGDEWTPGEPFGVAFGVDVGWSRAAAAVALADTAPQIYRVNLADAIAANGGYATQKALTDRGVAGGANGYTAGISTIAIAPLPDGADLRVRVMRTAVSGIGAKVGSTTYYADGLVLDIRKDLKANPVLSEADIVSAADLDWGKLGTVAGNLGVTFANITSATYRVVLGNGSILPLSATTSNACLATTFVNVFDAGAAGTQPICHPFTNDVTTARPMFRWWQAASIGKDYPAFRLRVWDGSGKTAIYDSGVRRAPTRDAAGVYSFTPDDLHVGEAVGANAVFSNSAPYKFSVSMLDAKFTTPNTSEVMVPFRTSVNGAGGALSGCTTVGVAVKYFGGVPVSTGTASLAGLLRVEAYASPDFAGAPLAATYVKNAANLANPSNLAVNAVLEGIPEGTEIYVRAYIDTDGSRTRDVCETWGYCAEAGSYRPKSLAASASSGRAPTAVVFMEDADADNNLVPDAFAKYTLKAADEPAVAVSVTTGGVVTATNLFAVVKPSAFALPDLAGLLAAGGSADALSTAYALSGACATDAMASPALAVTAFAKDAFDLTAVCPRNLSASLVPTGGSSASIAAALVLESRVKTASVWTSASVGTYSIPPAGPSAALRAKMEEDVVTAIRALPNNVQYRVRITY